MLSVRSLNTLLVVIANNSHSLFAANPDLLRLSCQDVLQRMGISQLCLALGTIEEVKVDGAIRLDCRPVEEVRGDRRADPFLSLRIRKTRFAQMERGCLQHHVDGGHPFSEEVGG